LKIAVISDTHAESLSNIPDPILMKLAEVDLIVHAGDFTEGAVLEGLRALGEVKAVHGNMDSSELKRMLPSKELFTVNGKRIAVTHGSGGPWGILLFNPGPARNSYGLLTIEEEVKAEIVMV
jgi:putative phosphoesterase